MKRAEMRGRLQIIQEKYRKELVELMDEAREGLRTPENVEYVQMLIRESKNVRDDCDLEECICIRSLILEHFSTEKIETTIEVVSVFIELEKFFMVNACPEHSDPDELEMRRVNLSLFLTLVEHCFMELERREREFLTESLSN